MATGFLYSNVLGEIPTLSDIDWEMTHVERLRDKAEEDRKEAGISQLDLDKTVLKFEGALMERFETNIPFIMNDPSTYTELMDYSWCFDQDFDMDHLLIILTDKLPKGNWDYFGLYFSPFERIQKQFDLKGWDLGCDGEVDEDGINRFVISIKHRKHR
jgi:hypothetical protein